MSVSPSNPDVPASRTAVSLGATVVIIAILLFWPAGTWGWGLGWAFLAALVGQMWLALAWIQRVNPEIITVRQGIGANTKAWDYVLMPLTLIGLVSILPVAAIDNARFGWSTLPFNLIVLGYAFFIGGFWIITWAQAVNRHFEPSVRIQTDRNHQVVETGPYAFVRHPGYVGASLMAFGWAFALGSLLAQVPALVTTIFLIVRTEMEDRTLQRELPGYAEYTYSVRAKWIPGLY